MRIAVVGSGIAGLASAWLLSREHEVLLFEANATMNFYAALPGPQFEYLQRVVPPARAAFRKLLDMERPQDLEFA